MSNDGAQIHQTQDPRLSKVMAWVWTTLGASLILVVGVAANNLYQLNVTVARGIDSDTARDLRVNDHEERLRTVERDVATINGKILRGEHPLQEK